MQDFHALFHLSSVLLFEVFPSFWWRVLSFCCGADCRITSTGPAVAMRDWIHQAEKYGGEYLARGGFMEVVQDELWSPTRIVIIKFPNVEVRRGVGYVGAFSCLSLFLLEIVAVIVGLVTCGNALRLPRIL